LEDVIWSIKKQSEFNFFYNSEDVKGIDGIDIDFKDATTEEILGKVLEGTGLTFNVVHKTIIIREKSEMELAVEKLKQQQPDEKSISGTVTDQDGLPLPGVSVVVKGTTIGTVTNAEGKFSLSIPSGTEILQFSFVGM